VTRAVHGEGGKILLLVLHAGRYGYQPFVVSASGKKSPISPFKPKALSEAGIAATIADYARCARLAQRAGYDGVEIMGSEGYLLSQFLCTHTNDRSDRWGGPIENRMRLAVEVVQRIRAAVGARFILMFRLSVLDLVEGGNTWDEIVTVAQALERCGVTIFNTGIGWHEARVPTIVTSVPRAAFRSLAGKLKQAVSVPVVASNRINMPDEAEDIIASGDADLVSMARPFLADAQWVEKTAGGRVDEINTCIACNQACLDHTFANRRASCLVNPRACHETELLYRQTVAPKRVAVVGAGPAGLSAATVAAECGHDVTLFDSSDSIGGQFKLAMRVPGKEEFAQTLRYFARRLEVTGVKLRLGQRVTREQLLQQGFEHIVLATGIKPRTPAIEGVAHAKVLSYVDVLQGTVTPGPRVAIVGAGGIGFDVAEFLLHDPQRHRPELLPDWCAQWGVDLGVSQPGGLAKPVPATPLRQIFLLQRKTTRVGAGLGKTSGWVHRAVLQRNGVQMLAGVDYQRIDDQGLHIAVDGAPRLLEVDHIVLCAGQEPLTELLPSAGHKGTAGPKFHCIGGAALASELDAKRAIREGALLASGW
jgi:2,4-dienoyl-CoA reductase (NADPH2)